MHYLKDILKRINAKVQNFAFNYSLRTTIKYKVLFCTFFIFIIFYGNITPPLWAQKPDSLTVRFKRYEITKRGTDGNYSMSVSLEGKKVFQKNAPFANHLQFVSIQDKYIFDITGDTIQNFVLQQYEPNEKRQTSWYILSLARFEFKVIDSLKCDFSVPWLSDLDKDQVYEIIVRDYAFASWNASFLDSPFVEVVLSLKDGKYQLNPELFRQINQAQDASSLSERIRRVMQAFYEKSLATYPNEVTVLADNDRNKRWGFIPAELWGQMLYYIHAGEVQKAKDFLAQAWYDKIEGKEVFWGDFKAQLSNSHFWEQLKAQNPEL